MSVSISQKTWNLKNIKKKAFFKSQNLKKPTVRRTNSLQPIDLPDENIVYSKEYTRNIPDFQSPDKTFKNSTVHYTKYRKEFINDGYSN